MTNQLPEPTYLQKAVAVAANVFASGFILLAIFESLSIVLFLAFDVHLVGDDCLLMLMCVTLPMGIFSPLLLALPNLMRADQIEHHDAMRFRNQHHPRGLRPRNNQSAPLASAPGPS